MAAPRHRCLSGGGRRRPGAGAGADFAGGDRAGITAVQRRAVPVRPSPCDPPRATLPVRPSPCDRPRKNSPAKPAPQSRPDRAVRAGRLARALRSRPRRIEAPPRIRDRTGFRAGLAGDAVPDGRASGRRPKTATGDRAASGHGPRLSGAGDRSGGAGAASGRGRSRPDRPPERPVPERPCWSSPAPSPTPTHRQRDRASGRSPCPER